MIEIFIGDDTQSARNALRNAVKKATTNESAVNTQHFSDIGFNALVANEAVFAQNLFGPQNIVIFDALLDTAEGEAFYAESLAQSPNNIYIRETAPNKETLTIFHAIGTVHEFPLHKKSTYENNFAIADALVSRDKKTAWVELVRALERGSAPEEVHGTVFWAVKMLFLCVSCEKDEAIKSGVNAQNYQRYLNGSKKYSDKELSHMLRELKDIYHDAHSGDAELSVLLERYILKI